MQTANLQAILRGGGIFFKEKRACFVWSFKQKNIFLYSHMWFLRKKSHCQLTLHLVPDASWPQPSARSSGFGTVN